MALPRATHFISFVSWCKNHCFVGELRPRMACRCPFRFQFLRLQRSPGDAEAGPAVRRGGDLRVERPLSGAALRPEDGEAGVASTAEWLKTSLCEIGVWRLNPLLL